MQRIYKASYIHSDTSIYIALTTDEHDIMAVTDTTHQYKQQQQWISIIFISTDKKTHIGTWVRQFVNQACKTRVVYI